MTEIQIGPLCHIGSASRVRARFGEDGMAEIYINCEECGKLIARFSGARRESLRKPRQKKDGKIHGT